MNNIECNICYESFNDDTICYINCPHKYCKICLDKWLETGNLTCPICRIQINHYNYNDIVNKIIKIPYTTNTTNIDTTNTIIINKKKLMLFKFIYGVTFTSFLVSVIGNAHCQQYFEYNLF